MVNELQPVVCRSDNPKSLIRNPYLRGVLRRGIHTYTISVKRLCIEDVNQVKKLERSGTTNLVSAQCQRGKGFLWELYRIRYPLI